MMAKNLPIFSSDHDAQVLSELMTALTEEALSSSHTHPYEHDNVSQNIRTIIQQTFGCRLD